jgi:hypothetical protein
VSSSVVHFLQAVNIDERDNERIAFPSRPIDLVLQFSKAWPTTQSPCEVIEQVVLPLIVFSIQGGLGPIESGLLTIKHGLLSVQPSLVAVNDFLVWFGSVVPDSR